MSNYSCLDFGWTEGAKILIKWTFNCVFTNELLRRDILNIESKLVNVYIINEMYFMVNQLLLFGFRINGGEHRNIDYLGICIFVHFNELIIDLQRLFLMLRSSLIKCV